MSRRSPPFAAFEWMIAWRYLRARRSDGGVSVMTWISLIGITLAVFALIATLAVRTGFRAEFVDTILGANAHVTVYQIPVTDDFGKLDRKIYNYTEMAEAISQVVGVTRAAPLIKSQVMASYSGKRTGIQVFGISQDNLLTLPRIARPEKSIGSISDFTKGVAIGSGVARSLNATIGDKVKLVSPDGLKTAFGTSPRVKSYEIVYIFTAGRYDIDQTRLYMPFSEAQNYFNSPKAADEIEVMVEQPEHIDQLSDAIFDAAGTRAQLWSWRDASGNFLRALEIEDNVMLIIMGILVLIATMNIVSGLIMLVKNKGRDIGILRTMGLSEGSVMRIFFICGAFTGLIGTAAGTVFGCLFAIYVDPIFALINVLSGGDVWDPSIRGIYSIPAELRFDDVLFAISLSLGLSFGVTFFPARRAARLNPVEALRYE
ncbi:MAG: lipoprotein-releasing ABC transporter permease subunit [Paracoccaceae bacterium]|nr:lipoprotein-releasing ABC transporter permease subunit [Paracoccaceae bacterium]